MYIFKDNDWKRLYAEFLTNEEVRYISNVLNEAIDKLGLRPEKTYGDIIENRLSQVTYSALGQKAPLEEKQKFDPDKKIRQKIVDYVKDKLTDYSIWIAWTTSIDITRKWLDKSYGIKKMMEKLSLNKEDILFIWDAIFPGWNDYPVKEFWIDCIQVESLEDTEREIKKFID
jgi:phosphomannomutase